MSRSANQIATLCVQKLVLISISFQKCKLKMQKHPPQLVSGFVNLNLAHRACAKFISNSFASTPPSILGTLEEMADIAYLLKKMC